jgi:hypothetical protein
VERPVAGKIDDGSNFFRFVLGFGGHVRRTWVLNPTIVHDGRKR